jgi:GNAT superfamily N-acetyltransferase
MEQLSCWDDYDGPRPVEQRERAALMELARSVFYPHEADYLQAVQLWPLYLLPEPWERAIAVFWHGKPVSMATYIVRTGVIGGCQVRIAFVGSVCTDSVHRGRGLASVVMQALLHELACADIPLAYISGARSLYYRLGAQHLQHGRLFELAWPATRPLWRGSVSLREASEADVGVLLGLRALEATRILCTAEDMQLLLKHRHAQGRPLDIIIVEEAGEAVASFAVHPPCQEGAPGLVCDFAGDRMLLMEGLRCWQEAKRCPVAVPVLWHDSLGSMLARLGYEYRALRSRGVFVLTAPEALMRSIDPLSIRAKGGALRAVSSERGVFVSTPARIVGFRDGGALLQALFGALPDTAVRDELVALRQMFPLLPLPLPLLDLWVI